MSETADRVKKIVVEHLGVEPDKVTEDASFIDDLGADSLDIVELVMAFEEEFGVEIPDDAAEKITTVATRSNTSTRTRADRDRPLLPLSSPKGGPNGFPNPIGRPFVLEGFTELEMNAPSRRDRARAGDAAGRRRRDELAKHPRRQERHRPDHPVRHHRSARPRSRAR